MKRSVACVAGFKRHACWLEVDQTGRVDFLEVKKGCSIVILIIFKLICSQE